MCEIIVNSYTNYKIIDENDNIIGENISKKELTYKELINSCDIGLSTVMCKREVLNSSKFKDIKTKEDYALWLELSRKGEKFLCLSRSLVCWRSTPKSLSRPFLTKIINGFRVYNKFEKKNLLISLFLVINLGLHYIKKIIDQKKNMKKIALISGITGQDGSYLAEFLLEKNYEVHGIKRKSSSFNTERIDHIYVDPHLGSNLYLHYGDLADPIVCLI